MIPYHIGGAGDAASLLCAVCAPAVICRLAHCARFMGAGLPPAGGGWGKTVAKRRRMQIFAIAKIIFATTNKTTHGR